MLQYPIKFEPILKEKIWGGNKLKTILKKNTTKNNVGESWEISNVKGDISVVSNGSLKGQTLQDIIGTYKSELLGNKVYQVFGTDFPLLIKYIDAKEALSIQLHPHDDLAKERHDSFGKTEMWYVMQADNQAELIVGFNKPVEQNEYVAHVENKTLKNILNRDQVKHGDVYFIPTGRIHAIGAGVMLAEIQQTSDITYRIYDWDRQDDQGNYRELHTDEAIDAIDYSFQNQYDTPYEAQKNKSNNIVTCPYFKTNVLDIDQAIKMNYSLLDSFVILMCVAGSADIKTENGTIETVEMGETVLLPAVVNHIEIIPHGNAELLEVCIPEKDK